MTLSNPFPRALIAIAAALACAPAAHAALPQPTLLAPERASEVGELTSSGLVAVLMTPKGGVVAGWISSPDEDTHEVYGRYRAPDGTWGATVPLSGAGRSAGTPAWISEPNGDVTFAWTEDSSPATVVSRTLDATTGAWSAPAVISDPEQNLHVTDADITQDAAGNAYLVYTADKPYLRVRPAGSATWGRADEISSQTGTYEPKVAVTGNGELSVIWHANPLQVWESHRAAGDPDWGTGWSAPQALSGIADGGGQLRIAASPQGRVAAAWTEVHGGTFTVHGAVRDPGAPTFGTTAQFGADNSFVPMLESDNNGTFVGAWLTVGASYVGAFSELDPALPVWTSPVQQVGEFLAATTGLTRRPDGSIYAEVIHGPDNSHGHPGLLGRSPSGAWGALDNSLDDENQLPTHSGGISSDDEGNVVLMWGTPADTAMIAIGDGAGPKLSDLSVPDASTTDQQTAFSVAAVDRFSDVASTSWDFGDGKVAAGTSVSHSYAQAGSYTVTVTSTDAVGNATSRTGTVTVTDPPPPPAVVKEKTKLPPVIPARLAGKKITITTTVPSCSSKFVATTKFGTTKYQTKLKLTKTSTGCTATGTITLRKTPSTRTKLRVAIGRVTKTGTKTITTLTTKRS